MGKTYQLAAVGGTFDHLHRGHRHLIESALSLAERVIIGLVVEPKLKEFPQSIQSYRHRYEAIKQTYLHRVDIVELRDVCGPTLSNTKIDLLVVSSLTQAGALLVNNKRSQLHYPPLPVHIIDMIPAEDGQPIASFRIRGGHINREGYLYQHYFTKNRLLKHEARHTLHQSHGELLASIPTLQHDGYTVLVGDRLTAEFMVTKTPFTHAVIDGHSRRRPVSLPPGKSIKPLLKAVNPRGMITSEAANAIRTLYQQKSGLLMVEGEEDLLVLPAVLQAPLGSVVFYGQPQEGLVKITVTEAKKAAFVSLFMHAFDGNSGKIDL